MYGVVLERQGIPIRYGPSWWVAHRYLTSRWDEGWRAFEQGKNGAFWSVTLGIDLFASDRGQVYKGPGIWLLSRTHNRPAAQRAASLSLLPLAAFFAALSAVFPGDIGSKAFSRFRRSAHLAGRLHGLATGPPPV